MISKYYFIAVIIGVHYNNGAAFISGLDNNFRISTQIRYGLSFPYGEIVRRENFLRLKIFDIFYESIHIFVSG